MPAHAQESAGSSVVVYGAASSAAPDPQGLMPEGVTWNHPLKAGDLSLQRTAPPQKKPQPAARAGRAPVGELQPPQIGGAAAKASPSRNDATGVMMMQGMKNALQQAGQNPDIPVSTALTPPPAQGDEPVMVDVMSMEKPVAITEMEAPKVTSLEGTTAHAYEPGQAPKAFVLPNKDGQKSAEPTQTELFEIPAAAAAAANKPTEAFKDDLAEETYVSLDAAPQDKIVFPPEMTPDAKKASASGSSIFGAPVEEPEETATLEPEIDEQPALAPAPAQTATPRPAQVEPKKESGSFWSRLFGSSDAEEPVAKTTASTTLTHEDENGESVIDLTDGTGEADLAAFDAAPSESEPQAAVPTSASQTSSASPDGSCGPANGLASASKPAGDALCQSGTPVGLSGSGPWRWSCKGASGGMTVSCAAPLDTAAAGQSSSRSASSSAAPAALASTIEDGACGSAHNHGTDAAPTSGLCAKGTPSRVNGSGPWTWACGGSNGGQAAACSAHSKTDGLCGAATREGTDYMPVQHLCDSGLASAVTGAGPWNWTCSGLYGGEAATCSAMPKQNAICGPASLTGHNAAPREGLCNAGQASTISGEGPWNWTCEGSHGGANVACAAARQTDGACGPAHGNPYDKAPETGLCAAGSASRVTGLGPWNWTCSGTSGGQTTSCAAVLGSREAIDAVVNCGEAAETITFSKPSDRLCAAGKASDVSGSGPWSWSCSDEAGHEASCSTLSASDGTCGTAADTASAQEPRKNLCASGTPSSVQADRSSGLWSWSCAGALGGEGKGCSAPMGRAALEAAMPFATASSGSPDQAAQNAPALAAAASLPAQCGSAAGRSLTAAPDDDLCAAGKASAVSGKGPWLWSCESKKAKAKVSCRAEKNEDGVCGGVNGSIQRAAPRAGLCARGEATEVTGVGPWMWSCIGSGGGSSVSCSAASQAQTKVDGTCGAASNALVQTTPDANLCDSGIASPVNGQGPWTWTCSGLNGGIASTCTTSKVLPKAPPPPGPAENGVCGASNGVAFDHQPEDGLCAGGMPSELSGQGPWNWSCLGLNGGMTVSCTAPLTPPPPVIGMCGSASGMPTMTTPKAGLCAAGISSAVSGKGPWTWSCSGTNGGSAVSCVAPKAGSGAGTVGTPSLTTPSLDGEAPAPIPAPRGLVTPHLTAPVLPPMKAGTLPSLTPSSQATPKEDGSVKDLAAQIVPAKASTALGALPAEAKTLPFVLGSDALGKEAVANLGKVTAFLSANPNARLTLVAYATTDGRVSPRQARQLSLKRALAARDYLDQQGIDSSRVDVKPMGANVPSGDMDRVDILVN